MYAELAVLLVLGVAGTVHGQCGRDMAFHEVTYSELVNGTDLLGGHRIQLTEIENYCDFPEEGEQPIGLALGLAVGGSVTTWKGMGWYHKDQVIMDRRVVEIRERQFALSAYIYSHDLLAGDLIFETYSPVWDMIEQRFCFVDAYENLKPGTRYHFSWEKDL